MRISPTLPVWRPENNQHRPAADSAETTVPKPEQRQAALPDTAERLKADLLALRQPRPSGVAGRYLKQAGSGEAMSLTTLVSRLRQLEATDKTGAHELLRHLQETSPDLYDLVNGQL